MTTTTRLSTSDVDAREGFDYWADAVSSTFVPLECSTTLDRPFTAELISIGVGDLQLTRVTAASHRVARTRRTIRRDDPEMIKVSLQLRGTAWISQDGRDAVLADGDLTMYDTSRPYTLMFDEHRQYSIAVVMFPGSLLGIPADALRRLTATRVSGRDGLGSLVSPFLSRLAESADGDSLVLSSRLGQNVLALLETVFRERLDLGPATAERVSTARLLTIKAWLDRHLDQPELTPETVAAAHHISLRYLHKLFEEEQTTVSRWIKHRRLEGCRRDFADPSLLRFTVTAVAARWGMLDPAAFSRSFRASYGLSPREYRARALGSPAVPGQVGVVDQIGIGSEPLRALQQA
jgi:AraC-like DNA-binding protein